MAEEIVPDVSEPEPTDDERTSRRHLFTIGAAAVAGVAAAELLSSQAADAATGGNMIIGAANTVTLPSAATTLTGAFQVTDAGGGFNRVSMLGHATSAGTFAHFGVQGISATGFNTNPPSSGAGVLGQGVNGAPGLMGVAGAGGSQLFLEPSGATAPAPGNFGAGHFMVVSSGTLFFRDGIQWNPVRSVVPLPAPIRIINSTNGTGGISGPLIPSTTQHVSSALAGINGIPSNAVALVGNFAISGVGGALLNGFGVATIFPAGVATPLTASINAGSGCFAISNTVTVGLGTGGNAGKVAIVWGGGGAVPNAQAFFDVTAYIV